MHHPRHPARGVLPGRAAQERLPVGVWGTRENRGRQVIIVATGSRKWRNIAKIQQAFDALHAAYPEAMFTLRQGAASGADAIARSVAKFYTWDVEDYFPDYMSYDFAEANKVRNIEMLEEIPRPALVLAFPTKSSRGTWHCVNAAKKRDIPVTITYEN